MIILSVIIPVYNTEAYLDRCISSVIVPEILNKIEILVINDGSTDASLAIAQKYQKRYPETIKVFDKSNGGKGSCMNLGLEMATGKYFRELDSDDYFNRDVVIDYINLLEKLDADIVATPHNIVNEKGEVVKSFLFDKVPQNQLIDLNTFTFSDYNADEMKSMHSLTHKTQIFRLNNFKFQENISYTDVELVFFGLLYSKTSFFVPYNLYQYFVGRSGSSTEQVINKTTIAKRKRMLFLITQRLLVTYNNQYSKLTVAYLNNLGTILYSVLGRLYYLTFTHYFEKSDVDVLRKINSMSMNLNDSQFEKSCRIPIPFNLYIPYYYWWKRYNITIPHTIYKIMRKFRKSFN